MSDPAPEVKAEVALARNRRTDSMFVVACLFIAWLIWIVVYKPDINQFAQGIVTTVLGMFLRELGSMFSFENGTTRASEQKGQAITRMAEQSAPTMAAAVAATVAATAAATTGAPPLPIAVPPLSTVVPPTTGATP